MGVAKCCHLPLQLLLRHPEYFPRTFLRVDPQEIEIGISRFERLPTAPDFAQKPAAGFQMLRGLGKNAPHDRNAMIAAVKCQRSN